MNGNKSVCIIGGGIAGLSAAVFLAEKGLEVTLIEASPKAGGRAYSFFDRTFGGKIDNGQHILAGWYKSTFRFLEIIGSVDKLTFQKRLEVNFTDLSGQKYLIKGAELPYPLDLVSAFTRYRALKYKDIICIFRLIKMIRYNKISLTELKTMNTDKLLNLSRQSEKAMTYFWNPFIIAVFNSKPENTSAYLFSNVIKEGFGEYGSSSLVLPEVFLDELYINPAINYLKDRNAKILINKRATGVKICNNMLTSIILEDNSKIKSNFYISAVPFFEFKKLFGKITEENIDNLNFSPIVNIHLKFDGAINHIITQRFYGMLNTISHWIFRIADNQICIVISAADETVKLNKEEIISIVRAELIKCFPEMNYHKITGMRVIKEMRATFRPDSQSIVNRPGNYTRLINFFIAGDWTDTGLPATIEGAVRSAEKCTELITRNLNFS